jgi:carbon monoxide dehydrogenase subunit G
MRANRRRWFLAWLAVLAMPAFAQEKVGVRSVDISQNDDGYVANMVMYAPVSRKIAWDVLTDFENMEKWVPSVKESTITSREGNVLTVEQKGATKFGLLSIPYTSVRRMQLDPEKSVLATQVSGSMKRLVSLMRLSQDGSGIRLDYKLELTPSAIAATAISKDTLRGQLTDQFNAIIGEMVRRAK